MRTLAIAFLLLGAVLLGGGLFFGCGYYAEWNGRNVVLEEPVVLDERSTADISAKAGRRYTFSARVTVDRRGVSGEDAARGASALELEMPFAMRVTDASGHALLQGAGVLSQEPPTSVYGQGNALVAERFVGPWSNADPKKLHVALDLGADRRGEASIARASLVVYDDGLPDRIKRAFTLAGAGALVFLVGMILGAVLVVRRYVRPR